MQHPKFYHHAVLSTIFFEWLFWCNPHEGATILAGNRKLNVLPAYVTMVTENFPPVLGVETYGIFRRIARGLRHDMVPNVNSDSIFLVNRNKMGSEAENWGTCHFQSRLSRSILFFSELEIHDCLLCHFTTQSSTALLTPSLARTQNRRPSLTTETVANHGSVS